MSDPMDGPQLTMLLSRLADSALGEAGRQAWQALVDLVRRIGRRDAEPVAALDALQDGLQDGLQKSERVRVLAEALERHADGDPEFAALLREWSLHADQVVRGVDVGAVNVVSGTVHGPNVQARDISGSVNFGVDDRHS